jgi:hypothetical protein
MANSSLKIQNPNFKIQTMNYYKIIKYTLLGFGILLIGIYGMGGCGDIEGELESLTISPSDALVGISRSETFRVIGRDSLGFMVEVAPTWGVTGGIGTISPHSADSSYATFKASSNTGEGYVVASYEQKSVRASVTVTENGWLEGRIQSNFGYVPGIRVELKDASLFDFSDSNGRYSISNIPPGTYEARTVETDVYQVASKEVTIDRGEVEIWDIFLETQPGIPDVPTTTLPVFP